jgi:Tfp pilus assembly protein PilO
MNRSRKDVTLMYVIGALLLFAAYNFLIKPQGAELSDARSQRAGVEQSVSDAELALVAPSTTVEGQPAVDPGALSLAIPTDPAISTLLRQLQAIAAETGVLQGSISPSPLSANSVGPGGSLQIAITASGPHDATQAYLLRLRDLERLFVIDQISISIQPADGTEQLQISARVFTQQPPPGGVVAVAVPVPATVAP